MDEPAYERDPYLRELRTEVLESGVEEGRPWAALADTILYPEGGGQPADRGWIGSEAVHDVQRREGLVRHYLDKPVPLGPTTVRLDWERRFDHMQQHSGQHLLSAIAEDRFGWRTTSFHLGARVSDVELDAPELGRDDLARLEEAVNEEVRRARPIVPRRVPRDALARLEVRTRGLPEDHEGDVRLVEIVGIDRNTCGGTHVRSTAEIESLALLGAERMRGGTRVTFVAGGRVRRRLAAREALAAELRALLGTGDDEAAAALRGRLEQAREAVRRERGLRDELARGAAESLALRPEPVVGAHFEALDAAFLQQVARGLARAAPAKLALLTAGRDPEGTFVLCAGEEVSVELRALGAEVAARLGGRGGGAGRLFQGRCAALAGREEALAWLRARVR